MVWIVPVPANAAQIVVAEYPLKTLNVGLSYFGCEVIVFLFGAYQELVTVVAHFPTFDA